MPFITYMLSYNDILIYFLSSFQDFDEECGKSGTSLSRVFTTGTNQPPNIAFTLTKNSISYRKEA
jgi:hypothetical protein